MKIVLIYFSLLISFINVGFAKVGDKIEKPKNIFILSSYHNSQLWVRNQAKGYNPYISNENYNLYIEELDEKRIELTAESQEIFVKLFNLRYSSIKFDLIVAIDNSALEFFNNNYYQLPFIQDIPVIAGGINFFDSSMSNNIPNITILEEASGNRETLEEIVNLFPHTDTIFCLIDPSETGKLLRKEIYNNINFLQNKIEKVKNITFLFNEDESFENILEKIKNLPKSSVILIELYERDAQNDYYPPEKLVKKITSATELPIFCTFDIYTNEKIIGGKVANATIIGKWLGETIVNFFAKPDSFQLLTTPHDLLEWEFSYPALKKHGIKLSSLPKNSTILYQVPPFLSQYKYLSSILLIIVLITFSIAVIFYIVNVQISRKVKKQVAHIADLFGKLNYLRKSMPIGFIELDSQFVITYWNESAQTIFGYSNEEAIGQNLFDLTASPEHRCKADAIVADLIQTSKKYYHSQYLQHKNKKEEMLQCEWFFTVKPDIEKDNFYVMCMVNDITEKEKMKKEQEALINMLKKMMLNQDRFIATSMHDIKNLIAPIVAYSELLMLHDLPQEKNRDLATKINKSITVLSNTFVEMMNVSKVKGEIIKAIPTEFNIKEQTTNVLAMLEENSKKKEITIRNNLPEQHVYADYEMIYSVLLNLCGNAIKFTHVQGEIVILGKMISQTMFEIEVKDNGVGLDLAKFELMLAENKYFTTVGTEGEEGTGLGLLLCKELIYNNHGTFRAENNDTGGASFFFTLPIIKQKQLFN